MYVPSADDYSGKALDRYIANVDGLTPAFAWVPLTWQTVLGKDIPFSPAPLEMFRTRGILPGLTWEPSKGPAQKAGPNQPEFNWKELASGRYDAYISQWARDAAAYGYPFLLRVLHEFDGRWYPWGSRVNGNLDVADCVRAWRRIVGLFKDAGAANVKWVWNVCAWRSENVAEYGDELRAAYPGDDVVDWIGLDGYNAAPADWRTLAEVFGPSYEFLAALSSKPLVLFEVGSLEQPSDVDAKATWIREGFLDAIPRELPRVAGAAWFNGANGAGQDFALDSSPQAGAAWKEVVASPTWQGRLEHDER